MSLRFTPVTLRLTILLISLATLVIFPSFGEKGKATCHLTERKIKQKLEEIRIDLQEGDLEEAEKLIEEVLCAKPNEINAIYFKGMVFFLKGKCEKAIDLFDTVIKRRERFPEAKLYRGICLMKLGLYDKALDDIRRYELLRVKSPLGYAFHFQILWAMKSYDEAIRVLDKGIDLTRDKNLRSLKISALIQLQRLKEAKELMRELEMIERRELESDKGDIMVDLAWYSFLIGDPTSMKRYIKLACERKRFSESSRDLLKYLKLLADGKTLQAFSELKSYKGDDPRIYYLRGILALSLLAVSLRESTPQVKEDFKIVLANLAHSSFQKACELEPTNLIYERACSPRGNKGTPSEEKRKADEKAGSKEKKS